MKILTSVKEGVSYFSDGSNVDVIFSDIQLGDDLSFEIFSRVEMNIPVIFCTDFDEYAPHAFRANGIGYVLKPFTTETVEALINNYLALQGKIGENTFSYNALEQLFVIRKTVDASAEPSHYSSELTASPGEQKGGTVCFQLSFP